MDKVLKEKIKHEVSRINKLFDRGRPLLDICKRKEPDFVESSAAGSLLQSFYNGVESIIVLILKTTDENIPNDAQWHKKLFETAFVSNEKRTAILRDEYKELLAEYLSFRHFFRHSYGFEIDWMRMKPLIGGIEALWKTVGEDVNKFIESN